MGNDAWEKAARYASKEIIEAAGPGLEDGAEAICQTASTYAPVASGTLQKGISTKDNMGKSHDFQVNEDGTHKTFDVPKHEAKITHESTKATATMDFGSYAPWTKAQEFGAGPHAIRPDPTRTVVNGHPRTNPHLKFGEADAPTFAKKVNHPGNAMQPFMRPAVFEKLHSGELRQIVGRAIQKALRRKYGPVTGGK